MERTSRIAAVCLALASWLVLAQGCEPRRQTLRTNGASADLPTDPVQDDPSFQRPKELNGFFKQNRYTGTFSSEAQEIETHLGILK